MIFTSILATSLAFGVAYSAELTDPPTNPPTDPPTEPPTDAPRICTLTGGENVEEGWMGKDTGKNWCNRCVCLEGRRRCTETDCDDSDQVKSNLPKDGECVPEFMACARDTSCRLTNVAYGHQRWVKKGREWDLLACIKVDVSKTNPACHMPLKKCHMDRNMDCDTWYAERGADRCDGNRLCKVLAKCLEANPYVPTTPAPTAVPTANPTAVPTANPTVLIPTEEPTAVPTGTPSAQPTAVPTGTPSAQPTAVPTETPSAQPTREWLWVAPSYFPDYRMSKGPCHDEYGDVASGTSPLDIDNIIDCASACDAVDCSGFNFNYLNEECSLYRGKLAVGEQTSERSSYVCYTLSEEDGQDEPTFEIGGSSGGQVAAGLIVALILLGVCLTFCIPFAIAVFCCGACGYAATKAASKGKDEKTQDPYV